jgi:hypothetical protein
MARMSATSAGSDRGCGGSKGAQGAVGMASAALMAARRCFLPVSRLAGFLCNRPIPLLDSHICQARLSVRCARAMPDGTAPVP